MNARRFILASSVALVAALSLPALAQATPDGILDQGFDGPGGTGNGKFAFAFNNQEDRFMDVAVQSDGKIVAVGFADTDPGAGSTLEIMVARFNFGSGSLDSTFDGPSGTGNGKFTLTVGTGESLGRGVAIDSAGHILIAGQSTGAATGDDFTVVSLDPSDGDFDTSFGGGDGIVTTSFTAGSDVAHSIGIDSAGRLVAVGSSNNDFAIARFSSTGSPDTSVNGSGRATIDIASSDSAKSVAFQSDGKVVVGGTTSTAGGGFDFGLARLTSANLNLDSSFDGPPTATPTPGNGRFALPLAAGTGQDVGNAVATQPGRVLAGGEMGGGGSFAVVGLNEADGSFDTGFGTGGVATAEFGGSTDQIHDLAIDAKNRVVAAGQVDGGATFNDFGIARFSGTDGSLDAVFDGDSGTGNGKIDTPIVGTSQEIGNAVAIESDGDLVTAGQVGISGSTTDSALVRYKVDLAPPNTLIAGPNDTNQASQNVTISSTEAPFTAVCTLDGDPLACTSGTQALGPLADGSHTFTAAAVDEVGNVDPVPASKTFTVDLTPPNTVITAGPTGLTSDTTPTFGFTTTPFEAAATFQCAVAAPALGIPTIDFSCTPPFELTLNGNPLADGEYTFSVRAHDALGNDDPTPDSRNFVVDAKAPETTLTGPSRLKAKKKTAPASFNFGSDEAGTLECSLDSAAFSPCSSPQNVLLRRGSHTFSVRATDSVGNVDPTPATQSVFVKVKHKRKK